MAFMIYNASSVNINEIYLSKFQADKTEPLWEAVPLDPFIAPGGNRKMEPIERGEYDVTVANCGCHGRFYAHYECVSSRDFSGISGYVLLNCQLTARDSDFTGTIKIANECVQTEKASIRDLRITADRNAYGDNILGKTLLAKKIPMHIEVPAGVSPAIYENSSLSIEPGTEYNIDNLKPGAYHLLVELSADSATLFPPVRKFIHSIEVNSLKVTIVRIREGIDLFTGAPQ